MKIRKFEKRDEEFVKNIISRNLFEVNIKDYDLESMKEFDEYYSLEKINEVACEGSFYVIALDDVIAGCGGVKKISNEEGRIVTFFILPDYHGKGVGKLLLEAIERDEINLSLKFLTVESSLTAHKFYYKTGYEYVNEEEKVEYKENYLMKKRF